MKRSLPFAALCAAVAALAVWAATAGGSTSSPAPVHVIEHAINDAVTNGTAADKPGNVLTFANPVYDAANVKKVGTDSGYCVRTEKGKTWECMWTTFLPKGQITVEGPFSDTGNTRLAITGGTGAYATTRGWMELLYHTKNGTQFDFVFHVT